MIEQAAGGFSPVMKLALFILSKEGANHTHTMVACGAHVRALREHLEAGMPEHPGWTLTEAYTFDNCPYPDSMAAHRPYTE